MGFSAIINKAKINNDINGDISNKKKDRQVKKKIVIPVRFTVGELYISLVL